MPPFRNAYTSVLAGAHSHRHQDRIDAVRIHSDAPVHGVPVPRLHDVQSAGRRAQAAFEDIYPRDVDLPDITGGIMIVAWLALKR